MRALAFFAAGLLVHGAYGQATPEQAAAPVPRIQGVDFDGIVDAAEWDAIEPLPVSQYGPTFGGLMSVESQLRLAYDDEYLYLAARCFDPEPPTMTTYKRDAWSGSDDQVALAIDSFNDSETAMVFVLYATEARVDAQLSNDARAIGNANTNWNTFWEGKVDRTEWGWQAEIRVPISSLRFETPVDGGPVTMGIAAYRYRARGGESHNYPGIRPDWGFWSFVKPSKMERRTFENLESTKPIYITPYAISGLGQQYLLNDQETDYERIDDPSYDVGLDLKYSITSNLTLDVTANTDFAQVEADNQQVNLTRFSLFFPEKRQFFLERTSNFDFGFGGNDRVFYTRRVGLSSGQQVRLLGGGRLVGRIGGWDVGFLTLQSGRDSGLGLDSENFAILRLKRRVRNANSYIGGIATSRVDESGGYNTVLGLDTQQNISGDDYLTVNVAQSLDSDRDASFVDASRVRIRLERARATGFGYNLTYGRSGADYLPGSGFQSRKDFSAITGGAGFGVRPAAPAPVSSYRVSGLGRLYFRNEDGSLETAEASMTTNVSLRAQGSASLQLNFTRDNLIDGFSLSDDARILAGTHNFMSARVNVTAPNENALRGGANVRMGSFYDGQQIVANVSPVWSPSSRLQLALSYQYNNIKFADRGESFRAHLITQRADIMLNTKLTFTTFLQFSSSSDRAVANARLRYNPREGNDFYLVWNEVVNTNRLMDSPNLPFTSRRALIVKYSYTFIK